MKTKKMILAVAVAALLGSTNMFAQDVKPTTDKKQVDPNELIDRRIQRMEKALSLDDAESAKFAPLYKEYLNDLRKCYAEAKCNQSKQQDCKDADRMHCMEKRFDCQQNILDTQKKYYNKFKKFLNARQMEMIFSKSHKHHAGTKCDLSNRHHRDWNQYRNHKTYGNCENNHKEHRHCK